MMFTNPDLPLELWLEILAYLPRSALHKLIGVNRFLFELALDDIYEEVRFIAGDKQMEKIFLQMESVMLSFRIYSCFEFLGGRFPNIAKRVKRFLIRPTFLPPMDSDEAESSAHSSRNRLTSKRRLLSHFNRLKYNRPEFERPTTFAQAPTTGDILQLAEKAIKLCPNLQDLTVVLHDHMLTTPFISFLKSLWKPDSIGPRLRTLRMDMTFAKIPTFLKPLIRPQKVLHNLEILSIDLAPSRFDAIPNRAEEATSNSYRALVSLRSFFSLFRDSLTSISISTHSAHDFRTLITYLPLRFPNLKKFEVLTVFKVSAHQTAPLFKFLNEHSEQLENLTIKPYPRQTSFSHTDDDDWYAIWISPSPPGTLVGGNFVIGFTRLILPKLQCLDIGLRERRSHNPLHWPNPTLNAKLLPDFNVFAPNLRSLVLSDVALSFERISDLVDSIGDGGSAGGLESVDLVATALSPHIFDLFSAKLPWLKRLTVEYQVLSDNKEQTEYHDSHVRPRVCGLPFSYIWTPLATFCGSHTSSQVSRVDARLLAPYSDVFLWHGSSRCIVDEKRG